jgi:hypothetical protein
MAAMPGGDTLFQGSVIAIAAAPEHSIQCLLLGRGWSELLFIGRAHGWLVHMPLFCPIGVFSAMLRSARGYAVD